MHRPRSSVLLALACCLLAPSGPGPATAGARLTPSVGAIIQVTEPMIRQVVQRRDDNVGNILFFGTYAGNVDGLQAQSVLRPGMPGHPLSWTHLIDVTILNGNFIGIFRQPAGGFYDLQIRPTYRGQAGAPVTVYAVGVGEVFITAGQSNTTNWGSSTGFAPDLRVSSFNPGPGLGIDPTFPGTSWQWGIDPQPALDLSGGGSVWPTMANNLAVVLGMPIGLYATGYTGTTVEQWLPGAVFAPPDQTPPRVVLFSRLTNAIKYFASRGGARAVLWMQGESDYGYGTSPAVYEANLRTVIDQSRAQSGVVIKWMVAQTSTPLTNNLPERFGLEAAQAALADNISTFPGPNADAIGVSYRLESNLGPLHFNATGLVLLGGWWGIYVYNIPGFLGPGYLPPP